MNKHLILTAVFAAASVSASAGGYLTNTNQSTAFLRNPAQNAVIDIQGAYFNPAGIGFMENGWHLALDWQVGIQRRYNTLTYAPLAYGVNNGQKDTKKYTGKTFVPVLPHFDLAYVHDKWFGSFHFGVVSGGGKATYDDGIASFETPVAIIPALLNNLAGTTMVTGYDADISLVGAQYDFAGQLNLGYRINDHWSVSAGLRMNYISNSYDGSLSNIQLQYGGQMLPAAQVIGAAVAQLSGGSVSVENGVSMASSLVADRSLDVHQKDIAWTPVLSVDYKTGKFNFSARYEFNTKVRLENDTKENTTGLSQYDDGKIIAADIPGSLSLGGQYSILPALRVSLGFNYYFDKQSKQYNSATDANDKQDYLKRNTLEFLGGVEYDLSKVVTLSAGANSSIFGFGDEAKYISDMSFTTNSVSVGLGARFNVSSRIKIDCGVYNTFFAHLTKNQSDYGGNGALMASKLSPMLSQLPSLGQIDLSSLQIPGKDVFYRKSLLIGVGASFSL